MISKIKLNISYLRQQSIHEKKLSHIWRSATHVTNKIIYISEELNRSVLKKQYQQFRVEYCSVGYCKLCKIGQIKAPIHAMDGII